MNTLDRTFVGATGALLMAALVVRTVAQQPQSALDAAATRASGALIHPQASLIVDADAPTSGPPTSAVAASGNPKSATQTGAATSDQGPQGAETSGAENPADKASTATATTPQTSSAQTTEQGKEKVAPQASGAANTATATGKSADAKGAPSGTIAAKSGSSKPTTTASADVPLVERNGDIVIRAAGAVYDQGKDVARITKDVRLWQEGQDFVLTCQNLVYDRGLDRAVATGDVKIEGPDTTITGDRLEGDFYKKVVVLTGHVDVNSRGKGDGTKTDTSLVSRSKPSHMICDRVEYNYETRDAVITGNIKMTQEGSHGTCDKILFDEENNIVTLAGHAVFVDDKGRQYSGPIVKTWLDKNVTRLDRAEFRVPQKPAPRSTKAQVEDVPTIPDEWLNTFKTTPAGGAPTANAGTAKPAASPPAKPVPGATTQPAPSDTPEAAPPTDKGNG